MAKGSGRKIGRNEAKCKRYQSSHRREMGKLKRVLRSNGKVAAQAYAAKHNLVNYLSGLMI